MTPTTALHTIFLLFAVSASTAACAKTPVPEVELKSTAYYTDHADEAKVVSDKCNKWIVQNFSAMSREEQEALKKSNYLNNCANADLGKQNAYQKRLRNAAKKYQ